MTRDKYLKLFKNLKKEISEMGYGFKFYYRKNKWNPDIPFGYMNSHVNLENKTISITMIGKQPFAQRLAAMAWQLRQALHLDLGRFDEYYNKKYFDVEYQLRLIRKEEGAELPSQEAAEAALRDCNEFALWFLEANEITMNPQSNWARRYLEVNPNNTFLEDYNYHLSRVARSHNLVYRWE